MVYDVLGPGERQGKTGQVLNVVGTTAEPHGACSQELSETLSS